MNKKQNIDEFYYEESGYNRNKRAIEIKKYEKITKNSLKIFLLGNDLIASEPATSGYYEPHIKSVIDFFAKKGNSDFLIDIGANIGLTTCQSGSNFKEIHMYEPNPICANVLKANCKLCLPEKNNYFIHEFGLGKIDQENTLLIPKNNFGGAFIKDENNHYSDELLAKKDSFKGISQENYIQQKIVIKQAKTELESLLNSLKVKGLLSGVIKIDVEGYELTVLEGLQDIPDGMDIYIIFESWNKDINLTSVGKRFKALASIFKISTTRKYKSLIHRILKKVSLRFSPDLFFYIKPLDAIDDGAGDIVLHLQS